MATATQIKAPESNLDQLCINSIRVLAIDAVQKANSGHPGMPMGMAPIAYLLWTRFMRYNPANPHWFGRDRFVLSAGHGSMLLYAMLYLTGYDLPLDADQAIPPTRQHHARPSRVRPDARRRNHHRAARPGRRQRRRDGDGGEASARPLRTRQLGAVRSSHLRHLRRRRPDGGRVERGGLDRRASRPRQHRLHLRRQPHHDRRRHRPVLRRERNRALRRLRLAHPGRRRRQRSRRGLARDRKRDRRGEPPLADSRAIAYRLRQSESPGHLEGARPGARRRRGQTDQALLRMARGAGFLRARRGAQAFPRLRRARARATNPNGTAASSATPRRIRARPRS